MKKIYKTTSILLIPIFIIGSFFFFPFQAHAVWCDNDFSNKQKITIDNTKVSATLTDFPVRVHITDGANAIFSTPQADGDDIVFYDEGDCATQLKHDKVAYDQTSSSEFLLYYVKVPTVSSSADTEIYMYYGDATAVSTEDEANTWDSNFMMVQTMEDVTDSTSNNNDGTATGATQGTDRTKGEYYDFDGLNDEITWGNNPGIDGKAQVTFEIYFETDNTTADHALFSRESGGLKPLIWRDDTAFNSGRTDTYSYDEGTRAEGSTNQLANTNDRYAVFTFDGNEGTAGNRKRAFIDGAEDTGQSPFTSSNTTFPSAATPLHTGERTGGGMDMNGRVFEVRISDTERSNAYIAANDSQLIDGDFITLGAEEDPPASSEPRTPIAIRDGGVIIRDGGAVVR